MAEALTTIDTHEGQARLPRQNISRRIFLIRSGAMVGGSALLGGCGGEKKKSGAEKSDAKVDEKVKFIHGTARVLEAPLDDPTLLIVIRDGAISFRSHQELQRQGWFDEFREMNSERLPREPSTFYPREGESGPGLGSGFAVRFREHELLCTNAHVLFRAPQALQAKAVIVDDDDVGIIPTEECNSKDGYEFAEVSDMTNAQLVGREVRMSGLGSHLFEITGRVYPIRAIEKERVLPIMPTISTEAPRFLSDYYCVVLDEHAIALAAGDTEKEGWAHSGGMSGTAVFDAETGKVVGVFGTFAKTNLHGSILSLMVFSGPEQLRAALQKMDEKLSE